MNWIFNSTDESWEGDFFDGTEGIAPGCLHDTTLGGTPTFNSPTGLGLAVGADDPCSCNVRITATGTATGGTFRIRMTVNTTIATHFTTSFTVPDNPDGYDSGWLTISGTLPGADTVDSVEITFNYDLALVAYPYEKYIDNVYVAESPSSPAALTHSSGGIPGAVLI